jgi:Flp pilus assembly protein TadD
MLKLLKALFSAKRQTTFPIDESATPITVYDERGRELKIPREEWREKVLQPSLRKHWDDPDALYQQILTAVNDGFASQVVEAAAHLVGIDPIPERAHTMHGIVLMKDHQLDAARTTLEAGMAKTGRLGVLLTNLAKVTFEQGDSASALDILWEAVQADPNLDNGMLWWAALQRERGGEDAFLEALRTVAALPDSWRAQLWLARSHLENGDTDTALSLYREVLPRGQLDGGALTMVSGDLGNYGQAAAIPGLIGPLYDPARHGMHPGLNLLQALHETRRIDEGEALLRRLAALHQPPYKQHLDGFAQAFRELRSVANGRGAVDPPA